MCCSVLEHCLGQMHALGMECQSTGRLCIAAHFAWGRAGVAAHTLALRLDCQHQMQGEARPARGTYGFDQALQSITGSFTCVYRRWEASRGGYPRGRRPNCQHQWQARVPSRHGRQGIARESWRGRQRA